jgi:hypothetical protein
MGDKTPFPAGLTFPRLLPIYLVIPSPTPPAFASASQLVPMLIDLYAFMSGNDAL